MKQIETLLILCILIFIMSGCSNEDSQDSTNSGNSVDPVIGGQMDNAGAQNNDPAQESAGTDERNPSEPFDVDYDLTAMSSDMVYATVYQMMVDPDTYVGKTIRMGGLYDTIYDEGTKTYYHYCIVQDALACCAQGLEFVWDDGSHSYPDEYPEENAEIVVQGVFETYQEDLFCRLKDATLDVVES